MPSFGDISASLVCNNLPLVEYPAEATTPHTTSVYCESTPEATFVVKVNGLMPTFDYIVKLVLDGVMVHSYACRCGPGMRADTTFYGIYLPTDPTRLMPFKFANIKLAEEDNSHPEEIVKNLGTIALEFFKCQLGHSVPNLITSIPQLASKEAFSERNKKASMIPHTIGFGEVTNATVQQSPNAITTHWIDNTPYQRLVWQYRSKTMLVTKGIIPRSVSPVPVPQPERKPMTKQEAKPVLDNQPHAGPSNASGRDFKPERKPKKDSRKPVVIELDDDDQSSPIVSSVDKPIILDFDGDDNEPAPERDQKPRTNKRSNPEAANLDAQESPQTNKRAKAVVIDLDDGDTESNASGSSPVKPAAVKSEEGATDLSNSANRFIDLT